mmetsp:Transcript_97031/g.274183  ORF Transcript_97031/g.274183 Transcript_97031/m.274183 type:complete len:292 (+) Transcript_97031:474-1349(+)
MPSEFVEISIPQFGVALASSEKRIQVFACQLAELRFAIARRERPAAVEEVFRAPAVPTAERHGVHELPSARSDASWRRLHLDRSKNVQRTRRLLLCAKCVCRRQQCVLVGSRRRDAQLDEQLNNVQCHIQFLGCAALERLVLGALGSKRFIEPGLNVFPQHLGIEWCAVLLPRLAELCVRVLLVRSGQPALQLLLCHRCPRRVFPIVCDGNREGHDLLQILDVGFLRFNPEFLQDLAEYLFGRNVDLEACDPRAELLVCAHHSVTDPRELNQRRLGFHPESTSEDGRRFAD